MNHTHSLEKLYGINKDKVLHIHGKVGIKNLNWVILKEIFSQRSTMIRQKGRGPHREVDIGQLTEDGLFDYYTHTAYEYLIEKQSPFVNIIVKEFVKDHNINVKEILGHSCGIDFPYFDYLKMKYPNAKWIFNPLDNRTKDKIINYQIV